MISSKSFLKSVVDTILELVAKHRGGKNPVWYRAERGSFNTCLVVEMDLDSEDGKNDKKAWAMMRILIAGATIFPGEKLTVEAAVMRFVADIQIFLFHISITSAPQTKTRLDQARS